MLARVRSTREPAAARLVLEDGAAKVVFDDAEEGVAPGQACVLYDAAAGQARMLGGGFIRSAVSQGEVDGLPAVGVSTAPLVAR